MFFSFVNDSLKFYLIVIMSVFCQRGQKVRMWSVITVIYCNYLSKINIKSARDPQDGAFSAVLYKFCFILEESLMYVSKTEISLLIWEHSLEYVLRPATEVKSVAVTGQKCSRNCFDFFGARGLTGTFRAPDTSPLPEIRNCSRPVIPRHNCGRWESLPKSIFSTFLCEPISQFWDRIALPTFPADEKLSYASWSFSDQKLILAPTERLPKSIFSTF